MMSENINLLIGIPENNNDYEQIGKIKYSRQT